MYVCLEAPVGENGSAPPSFRRASHNFTVSCLINTPKLHMCLNSTYLRMLALTWKFQI